MRRRPHHTGQNRSGQFDPGLELAELCLQIDPVSILYPESSNRFRVGLDIVPFGELGHVRGPVGVRMLPVMHHLALGEYQWKFLAFFRIAPGAAFWFGPFNGTEGRNMKLDLTIFCEEAVFRVNTF